METVTLDEVLAAPARLESFVQQGKTVAVTKDGKPYFNIVPAPLPRPRREFDRQIDAVWAGSDRQWSNDQIVDLIRQSRE